MVTNVRPKTPKYSERFEECWKLYGRKEEKGDAFEAWKIAARAEGGEDKLRDLVVAALAWQAPLWAADGWKFAKYFARYLKKRKWADEAPPAALVKPERRIETFDEARRRQEREAEIAKAEASKRAAAELERLRKGA